MIFLKALFVVVEALCCLMLIGIILLQRAKNEGLGLAFGAGAGESLFGARAGNVLSKATVVLGVVFLANTLLLGVLFSHRSKTLMESAQPSAQPTAVQTLPEASLDMTPSAPLDITPSAPILPIEPAAAAQPQEGM